jgi:hypothetical protein
VPYEEEFPEDADTIGSRGILTSLWGFSCLVPEKGEIL